MAWMPAHCSEGAAGQKRLSNGDRLTVTDVRANSFADKYAKQVPRGEKPPLRDFAAVRRASVKLEEAARWLGRITALANHFPVATVDRDGAPSLGHIRDAEGIKRATTSRPAARKTTEAPAPPVPGDLSSCPRWAAIRQRVAARSTVSSSEPAG